MPFLISSIPRDANAIPDVRQFWDTLYIRSKLNFMLETLEHHLRDSFKILKQSKAEIDNIDILYGINDG